VKKVIEILERILRIIPSITVDNWVSNDGLTKVRSLTEEAIAELQAPPRWYTPEEWGEPWPDNGAVYARARFMTGEWSAWAACNYADAKLTMYTTQIICATEAGPPPDDWRPEGKE
jgi:hypothetical protein